jgi:ribose/xylose/arabinose/galactoside ABC-type transport system permease subunit
MVNEPEVSRVEDHGLHRSDKKIADRRLPLKIGHIRREPLIVAGVEVLLLIVFRFTVPTFWTTTNLLALAGAGVVLAILAIGQSMTMIAGGIDLSVGGVVPLASVVFVLLSNSGLGTVPAILATLVIAGVTIGLLNAISTEIMGVNPLIATLATLSVGMGAANILANGLDIPMNHANAAVLASNTVASIPAYLWLLLGLIIVGTYLLTSTSVGRSIFVIGSNRSAADVAGIRSRRVVMCVYIGCAVLAALGGIVESSRLLAGSPGSGSTDTLSSITAVVLGGGALTGGVGSVGGTMIGVLVIATLSDGMALLHVSSFSTEIFTGMILLVAVAAYNIRGGKSRKRA